MIYITGDTHGRQEKWMEQIDPFLKPGDTIIVCGDFGIGFWDGPYFPQEMFFDYLEQQPYTVLFIDGNHENFDQLFAYPEEIWNGGRVHQIRSSVIHLMRGEVFHLEGLRIFTMGGGYSIDQPFRTEGISWWSQEMPSAAEYDNGRRNLEENDWSVDMILTHTAPLETLEYLKTMKVFNIRKRCAQEAELNNYLDEIQSRVKYSFWYFGHFHADAGIWRGQYALFNCIRELKTGKIVRGWNTYEYES